MAKKITALLLGAVMMAAVPALAATYTCSVLSIEDGKVVLECTDTDGMAAGDKVKVKSTKKKTAIEGC